MADATSGNTGFWLIVTTGLTAAETILAASVGIWRDRKKRKDALNVYKREVYRNFLDHAYWLGKDKEDHAELYVADWHRILLLGDTRIRKAIDGLRDSRGFSKDKEYEIVSAFTTDIGLKGVSEVK